MVAFRLSSRFWRRAWGGLVTDEWVPLQYREGGVPEERAILAEGVPEWLRPSLWHWLEGRLLASGCSQLREFVNSWN